MSKAIWEAMQKPAWLAACIATVAILFPLTTLRTSLWIDELHTAWVCLGSWNQLIDRAQAGNQSPLYFAFLKASASIAPLDEISLRIPSAIAWWIAIFFSCRFLIVKIKERDVVSTQRSELAVWSFVGILIGWCACDWIAWFYAIEARPYAVITLCTAVLCITFQPSRSSHRVDPMWTLFAWLAPCFHITAIFVVLSSWLARSMLWHDRGGNWPAGSLRYRLLELGLCLLGWTPLVALSKSVFAKRELWANFASDSSLVHLSTLLDFIPWLFIPGMALLGSTLFRKSFAESSTMKPSITEGMSYSTSQEAQQMLHLLAIAILPAIGVWMTTWLEIAPLMHRRYILGSHIALFLFAGLCLLRLQSYRFRCVVGALSILSMTWAHGQWNTWQNGEWMGWQRDEDWRSALKILDMHREPSEPIYLAPMLIETQTPESMAIHDPEYTAFVVRAIYPEAGGFDSLTPGRELVLLSNDLRDWPSFLRTASRTDASNSPPTEAWLIVRKTSSIFENEASSLQEQGIQFGPINRELTGDFGSVQVRRFVVPWE